MSYLGLVPNEHSSGAKRHLGAITKSGSRLMHKGKYRNVVVTAIAREMNAYIWAISREVVLTQVNPKLRIARIPA
jgi:transposase